MGCCKYLTFCYLHNTIPIGVNFDIIRFDRCGEGVGRPGYDFTYSFNRSYKCQDKYNSYVPTGQHDGVSSSIPASKSHMVTVTLKFKYKTVVGNNDECEVKQCNVYLDAVQSGWYSCEQNVGSGKYKSTSRNINMGYGVHNYWIGIRAKGLRCNTRCISRFQESCGFIHR